MFAFLFTHTLYVYMQSNDCSTILGAFFFGLELYASYDPPTRIYGHFLMCNFSYIFKYNVKTVAINWHG